MPRKKAEKPKVNTLLTDIVQVPVSDLHTYEKNPRVGNVEAIADSLAANGQFKPIVVQQSTMQVLAGNHTFMAAKSLGWDAISAVLVDVDDTEAKRIVLADNRTTEYGGYHDEILADLLSGLDDVTGTGYSQEDADALTSMLDAIERIDIAPMDVVQSDEYDDTPTHLDSVRALKDSVRFPSKNFMEIPDLLPDMIPDLRGTNIEVWAGPDMMTESSLWIEGEVTHWLYIMRNITTREMPWEDTIVAFYTDDDRFADTWDKPAESTSRLLNRGVTICVEPDYSMWANDPLAIHLMAAYKMRWVGRYWQEAGIQVIPNLTGPRPEDFAFCTAGVPQEPNSAAINLNIIDGNEGFNRAVKVYTRLFNDHVQPKSLLVYGNYRAEDVLDAVGYKCDVHYVEPVTRKRRRVLDSREDEDA